MLKAERDQVMAVLTNEERQVFWQFIDRYREARKTSAAEAAAQGILEAMGPEFSDHFRQAMAAVATRDQMGPHVGETPPDFNLKRLGSDDRVQLSSFKGERPVAVVFGSYT